MKKQGYLQVELLAVVMIFSVSAAFLKFSPEILQNAALEGEARLLASDLRWLQQYSMNLAAGNIDFSKPEGDRIPKMYFLFGADSGYSILCGPSTMRRHQFSHHVTLAGNYHSVYFHTDGYINTPVSITLYQGTKSKKVIVDRVGRIRVND